MKIFIPSKGRPDRITTHLLFRNLDVDYKIVLHNDEERSYYLLNKTVEPKDIIVSNTSLGVAYQRQWIQENLVKPDEWYISLDDNIKGFKGVNEQFYQSERLPAKKAKSWRDVYDSTISPTRFLEICNEMKDLGEKIGAYNLGFAVVENYFFREVKYRYVGYVISKAVIRKNLGIPFELEAQSMEDYAYTAECLKRHGKVLINNYIWPVAGHYEKGGIGTYKERLPHKIKDSAYLMAKYPGLFRYPKKKSYDNRGELVFKPTNLKQVEKWRKNFSG